MSGESNEFELARRAREGDQEALAALVEGARRHLFALAHAELRHYDDAQDALASALLQICLHVGELREPEHVRAWMQTIVRNEVRMHLRRGLPETLVVSLEELSREGNSSWGAPQRSCRFSSTAAAAETTPSLLRLDILRALKRLPWDEARAVALFYLSGLSIREIAQLMGRAEGTIKRWLHLGRRRLATELEEYAPRRPVCDGGEIRGSACVQ